MVSGSNNKVKLLVELKSLIQIQINIPKSYDIVEPIFIQLEKQSPHSASQLRGKNYDIIFNSKYIL